MIKNLKLSQGPQKQLIYGSPFFCIKNATQDVYNEMFLAAYQNIRNSLSKAKVSSFDDSNREEAITNPSLSARSLFNLNKESFNLLVSLTESGTWMISARNRIKKSASVTMSALAQSQKKIFTHNMC